MNAFLAETHSLDEFKTQILHYKDISIRLPSEIEHTITIGLYDMHRSQLIGVLVDTAKDFALQLMTKCVQDYQNNCRQ